MAAEVVEHKKGPPRDDDILCLAETETCLQSERLNVGEEGILMDGTLLQRTADEPISHYYTEPIKTYFIAANK